MENDLMQTWERLLAEASSRLPAGATETWLRTCAPTSFVDGVLVLDVPNVFVKEQISSRFLKELNTIFKEGGEGTGLELRVGSETKKEERERAERAASGGKSRTGSLNPATCSTRSSASPTAWPTRPAGGRGPAGLQPLFIWGVAETLHLMHAIGRTRRPQLRV